MEVTMNVFSEGNNDCNHEWVYDNFTKMYFSNPPAYEHKRICLCCKRIEKVLINDSNLVKANRKLFNKILQSQ